VTRHIDTQICDGMLPTEVNPAEETVADRTDKNLISRGFITLASSARSPLSKKLGRIVATISCLGLLTGCRTFTQKHAMPVAAPPAVYQQYAAATRNGFEAIYEGELRIWFHSIRTIWIVAADDAQLSIAILSPSGMTIMQMHGNAASYKSHASLPPAKRLEPYGKTIWQALWYSLAISHTEKEMNWHQRGQRIQAHTITGTNVRTRYRTDLDDDATIMQVNIKGPGRTRHNVHMENNQPDDSPRCPEHIEIRSRRPRVRLTLSLKDAYVNQSEAPDEPRH